MGRRIKSITEETDGTVITRYNVYDASGSLIYVVQQAPGTADDYVTSYVKLDGQTLARVKSTGFYTSYSDEITYLHHDHLGSAVAGTDESGDVLWTEKYTPYGISLVNDAANDNQAGFTGHIKDTDTGLTYMQARYYDPVIGRFLSIDPVTFLETGNPSSFNRYMYGNNDPINMFDPDGRQSVEVEIKARQIGNHSSAQSMDNGQTSNGNFGHAFVQYTDTATGDSMVTNAFPTNNNGALFPNGETLEARNSLPQNSGEPGGTTFDNATVNMTMQEAQTAVNGLVQDTNAAAIPYSGSSVGGQNSNNFAGEAFETLTGRAPVNDSGLALPGLSEALPKPSDHVLENPDFCRSC